MRLSLVGSLAISMIVAYQRFISPYKGFHCAFRRAHGGPGCSEFGKQAIREHGFSNGIRILRQRFRECAVAAQELRESDSKSPQGIGSIPVDVACQCAECGCLSITEIATGCGI
jgi:putative component of membrane protein insertase Oxa1/YidC/SpoIIIJ protein YidD